MAESRLREYFVLDFLCVTVALVRNYLSICLCIYLSIYLVYLIYLSIYLGQLPSYVCGQLSYLS